MIAATNGWLVVLDNISRVPLWLPTPFVGYRQAAVLRRVSFIRIVMKSYLTPCVQFDEWNRRVATRSDLLDRHIDPDVAAKPTLSDALKRSWKVNSNRSGSFTSVLMDARQLRTPKWATLR